MACHPLLLTLRSILPTRSLCGGTTESLPPSLLGAPPHVPHAPLFLCGYTRSSHPSRPLCGYTSESVPPSTPHAPHGSILPHVLSAVVLWRACHLSSSPLSPHLRSSSCTSHPSRP